jgi:pyruvate formate-lyase/glycerol dehydratase family glycyl radical enzyme
MRMVTLKDISLTHITLDSLPRLKRLREKHFATVPEVCTELPKNITDYLRCVDNETDSPELRAGKLYKYVMEKKMALIHDESLLAGTTSTKPIGVLVYPDFYALSLWPELETMATRKSNPYDITPEARQLLNSEIFPYWPDRTIMERTKRFLVEQNLGRKIDPVQGYPPDIFNQDEDLGKQTHGYPRSVKILQRLVFYLTSKAETLSHTIPSFPLVLEKGLQGIIDDASARERLLGNSKEDQEKRDFYRAVQSVLAGVINYAARLGDEADRAAQDKAQPPERLEELLNMSKICHKVPAHPANSFREALQAIFICMIALHQENLNAAMSFGRLDQLLFPFYQRDMQNGEITVEEAAELVGCFWIEIGDHWALLPEASEQLFGGSSTNQAATLGGVDRNGKDAVNDLTYVMLRVTELLKLRNPNVNARYYPGVNSRRYLERLCEVNVTAKATPCFHNDKSVVKMLQGLGVSLEDARDYGIVGCVEPTSVGRTYAACSSIILNLTSALEMALFQGRHRLTEEEQIGPLTASPLTMKGIEEFKEALLVQIQFLIEQAVELNNAMGLMHQQYRCTPMLSALMEGCLETGRDVIQGGAKYNTSGSTIIGLAEVVDSVNAIQEFVFQQKVATMAEMMGAIMSDWAEPYAKLHARVKRSREKFGTDSKMAAENARWLMDFLHRSFRSESKNHYRGGRYTVGYWTMTNHAGYGTLTGALPSGRKKGVPFASGITPVSGAAPELLPALNFVAHLEHEKITNGQALNLKFTPGTATPIRFPDTIEGYFKEGGLQIQFNIIDRETFRKAQQHPEDYPDMLVRVSGYTAYFKDLNPAMQNEIITRAEYDLSGGVEQKE